MLEKRGGIVHIEIVCDKSTEVLSSIRCSRQNKHSILAEIIGFLRGEDLAWNFCLHLQYEIRISDETFGHFHHYQVVVKASQHNIY